MTAVLVPHPSADLRLLREVVAHPDFHTDGVVLDACEQLETRGDWIDRQRARELQSAILRDAVAEVNRRGRRRRLARRIGAIICGMAVAALLLGRLI